MKTSSGLSVVVAAIALTVVGGCGGRDGLDRAQLIAKADPICRRGNEKLKESKIEPNNIASVAPAIAVTYERVSTELAKLTPPPDMAADWKVIVDEWRRAGEAISQAGRELSVNDTVTRRKGTSEFLVDQQVRSVAASRNGFVGCARY